MNCTRRCDRIHSKIEFMVAATESTQHEIASMI
jgi:hypothetical protein